MRKIFLINVILFCLSIFCCNAGKIELNSDTFAKLKKNADAGDAKAQSDLGILYEKGMGGVEQDYKKAVYWFEKAYKNGDMGAAVNLGNIYSDGNDIIKQDNKLAVEYYRKAARKGSLQGKYNLGLMYFTGEGVKQDRKKGVELFKETADKGEYKAQTFLSTLYYKGDGVKKDPQKALELAHKAAEQGYVPAMQDLQVYYYFNAGIKKDLVKAYMWAYIGSLNGNGTCSQAVSYLNDHMSASDIAKAKELATKWMSTHKTINQGLVDGTTVYRVKNGSGDQPISSDYHVEIHTQ